MYKRETSTAIPGKGRARVTPATAAGKNGGFFVSATHTRRGRKHQIIFYGRYYNLKCMNKTKTSPKALRGAG
jgi:hypothetical protein